MDFVQVVNDFVSKRISAVVAEIIVRGHPQRIDSGTFSRLTHRSIYYARCESFRGVEIIMPVGR